MTEKLACFVAIWALVAAPALCRAGVLKACCAPGQPAQKTKVVEDDCCKKNSSGSPAEESEPRECDTCVHVCDATASAPQLDGKLPCCEFLPVDHVASSLSNMALPIQPFLLEITTRFGGNLPIPLSALPLLI